MKKFLASLCMVLALVACKEEKKQAEVKAKPVIKIGAILPLIGPQASIGEACKAGMQKALKEKGKSSLHYDYQLVFEDNQAKLASMPAIAGKMIMQDNVDAISTMTTAMARVIAPVCEQNKKLLYVFSMEQQNYERFGKYVFVQGMSIEAVVDKFVNLLLENKLDNIVGFVENIGVLGPFTTYLENKLAQVGIKYKINSFNPGERDFKIAIETAKNEGYTNFVDVAFPPEGDIILKQFVEAGVKKDQISVFSLDTRKSSEFYEGMKTVTYNSGTDDFVDSIRSEYNIDITYGSAVFYDYVSLMIDAYENLFKEGKKPTAEEVTAYIHNKKVFPCMSSQCVVNPNGFILSDPMVRIYRDGKWQGVTE